MTTTIASLLAARADDDHRGLMVGEQSWSWRQVVAESALRGRCLDAWADGAPLHVGILLGNVPEYLFWLGGAALGGHVVVGINSTRRGEALADDVRRTHCAVVLTDGAGEDLLTGLDLAGARLVRVDGEELAGALQSLDEFDGRAWVAAHAARVRPDDLFLLLFTSGTTGAPKAVRCTQGRLASIAERATGYYGYHQGDVAYCMMPLFHGNALMALWAPALSVGAAVALAPRFSASGFARDVRRYGVTMFTYVGKALAYILATPPEDDDATTTLVRGFGTEASVADQAAFEARFGCTLVEGYGSSEGGVSITRTPDTPLGALGKSMEDVAVVDPESHLECPPARFDSHGRILNADEAIGEIVNREGGSRFEGYYNDEGATAERLRDGWYWTGDLGYRDDAGFFYFAGRTGDWMRVDSENLTAGPIERVLLRHPDVAAAAVVAVPDPRTGDQVLAALELLPGREFDPEAFAAFLTAQPDLGTKWLPSFIRIADTLPQTASGRTTKAPLRRAGWWVGTDPVYQRSRVGARYSVMTGADREQLRAEFLAHGRADLLDR